MILVCRRGQVLPPSPKPPRVVTDLFPGSGPLGGLYTGISASRAGLILALACDMPLVRPQLLQALIDHARAHGSTVPVAEGRPQPLCAVYEPSALEIMRRRLEDGQLKLTDFLAEIQPCFLQEDQWRPFDPRGLSFFNINSKADLVSAAAVLQELERATQPP